MPAPTPTPPGEPASALHVPRPSPALPDGWKTASPSSTIGRNLEAVCGLSDLGTVAVGARGTALRMKDGAVERMSTPTDDDLNDVCRVGDSEMYAVGSAGTVLRYDGGEWMPVSFPTDEDLQSVWGFADGPVFALGEAGYRFDGTTWEQMDLDVDGKLLDIWGASPDDLYVVTNNGVVHFDGQHWTIVHRELELSRLSGFTDGRVLVTGGDVGRGVILEGDAGHLGFTPADCWLTDVWCADNGHGYAVGFYGSILEGSPAPDGRHRWNKVHQHMGNELTAIGGTSPDEMYAVGLYGTILYFDGSEWTSLNETTDLTFKGVATEADGTVYVAEAHEIFRFDGRQWDSVYTIDAGQFDDIWVADDGRIFATGARSGHGFIAFWTGDEWYEDAMPLPFHDVVGVGDRNVWYANVKRVLHNNSYRTVPVIEAPARYLAADPNGGLWGADGRRIFYASEARGGSHKRDDELEEFELDGEVYSLWADATTAVAAGADGFIARFDGSGWQREDSGVDSNLYAVWGPRANELYAAGGQGVVLFWDGSRWTPIDTGAATTWFAGAGGGREPVWVVGDGAVIGAAPPSS